MEFVLPDRHSFVGNQVPGTLKTGYTHIYGALGISACTVMQM
jgi:hypothetical protein